MKKHLKVIQKFRNLFEKCGRAGGTAAAACELVEKVGGKVAGCAFVVELGFLPGREKLGDRRCEALITY